MPYSNDWVDSVPVDHTKFSATPGAIRTVRVDIEQRLSNLFYGWISGETQASEGVKALPFVDQGGDPGGVAGKIKLYSKYDPSTINYIFTVTSANATAGATYTNNGKTFTVINTISGATTLNCHGSANPSASGTLTKASGTGDATITFSAFSNPSFPAELWAEDEENNVIQITKNGAVATTPLTTILAAVYPVGSLYAEVTGVNPATTFGFGTWAAWGAGRVPVGVDITDYVFVITSGNATVGDTYTNNTQTFTVKQTISGGLTLQTSGTGAPAASGTLTKASGAGDSTLTFSSVSSDFGTVEATGGEKTHIQTASELVQHTHTDDQAGSGLVQSPGDNSHGLPGGTGTGYGPTSSTGGGQAMNVMQPFITCYMWKRTA